MLLTMTWVWQSKSPGSSALPARSTDSSPSRPRPDLDDAAVLDDQVGLGGIGAGAIDDQRAGEERSSS